MKIRVAIPTLNNQLLTLQCLTALKTDPDFEEIFDLVIVDNGSTDNTLALVRESTDRPGSNIRVIQHKVPRDYSGAINKAANLKGEWTHLVVLNNDTIPTVGALRAMAEAMNEQSRLTLAFSPSCITKSGNTPPKIKRPEGLEDIYQNVEAVNTWWERVGPAFKGVGFVGDPYVSEGGYAFMVERSLWDELGGFDCRFDLFGGDYDLFARARRVTKMLKVRKAFVDHLEHQTVAWLGLEREVRMAQGRFKLEDIQHGCMELVSVVIPVYNRVDALQEAIDSVLRQNMPHWRLYVVSDHSDDWDRIQAMAARRYSHLHGKVWFFQLPENRGPGGARNFGIEASRGKYIAFLDSDDVWYPQHLERHVAHHERTHCLMSYSPTDFAWRWWDETVNGWQWQPSVHPEVQLRNWEYEAGRIDHECFIKTSTVVVWGELMRSGGFKFPEFKDHRDPSAPAEDWELFRKIDHVGGIAFVNEPTGRTHWSRRPEEAHHSARLNPLVDFDTLPHSEHDTLCQTALEGPISAVIPTRGRPEHLRRCLDALPSTMPKVVVIDGRDALAPLADWLLLRSDVTVLTYPVRMGACFARNIGMSVVRSEWTWFMDDDDIALPGGEATILKTSPATAAVFDLILSQDSSGLSLTPEEEWYTSGLVVKTEIGRRVQFDTSLNIAEEREFAIRLGLHGHVERVFQAVAVKTTGAGRPGSLKARIPRGLSPRELDHR